MDSLRGNFGDRGADDATPFYDLSDEEIVNDPPPSPVGQDERRMQVRAYNHWTSLLDNRNFPSVEDLDPEALPDFGPYSVLLDFTGGIENPAIQFLGEKLAGECGTERAIKTLADVPSRSLLSRITDHYMQILANQAPIGFEAEFVNQRESTILYRGILLPFSSDDDTIDFIYGVINWKEIADQQTTDELMLEIDQALEAAAPARSEPRAAELIVDWADGPTEALDLGSFESREPAAEAVDWPEPAFGGDALPELELSEDDIDVAATGIEPDSCEMSLADYLASARDLAQAAKGSEDRTRSALYAAIGRAYDFSLAAADAPDEFAELVADSGLTVQDRAPMTPVVKLVFGADYDKTRLTEYAAALGHAQRLGLGHGALASYLAEAPGGLKGVVTAERRLRRAESGKPVEARETPRETLARKLRELAPQGFGSISPEGNEFTLLVARRMPDGAVALLGEVGDDVVLLERAARKLLAA
jgi:hypothetical protein